MDGHSKIPAGRSVANDPRLRGSMRMRTRMARRLKEPGMEGGGALKTLCKLQWTMVRFSGASPLETTVRCQSEVIQGAREYARTYYVLWLLAHNLPSHRIGSAVFSVDFCSNFTH
jgi:hypothetical protein